MRRYTTQPEAIIDLHERGFTSDFQLFGNDLLWIQEKIFVRAGEFSILEYHHIESCEAETKIVIFGIVTLSHLAKGILLNHYASYTSKTPPVIVKKLKEANLYIASHQYHSF